MSRPFADGYAALRPHLEYLQVKDARRPAKWSSPAKATGSSSRR